MTNLVKMLDALDTAVTEEEVLTIESKLIKLYRPSVPKFDRVASYQIRELSLASKAGDRRLAE
jgi:hypothetical protein